MNDHGWIANFAAAGTLVVTLAGYLPPLAAAVALLWYFVQIKESETFKEILRKRLARRIAKLKDKLRELERSDT